LLLFSVGFLLFGFGLSFFLFYKKRKLFQSDLPDKKRLIRFYYYSSGEVAYDTIFIFLFELIIGLLWDLPEDPFGNLPETESRLEDSVIIFVLLFFTGYGLWEWYSFKKTLHLDKEKFALDLSDAGYLNGLLGAAKAFNVLWIWPDIQWCQIYGNPTRRNFFKEEGITLDIYSFFLPVDQDMKPFCYAEDFLIVYFLLAIVAAAGFGLWAKKKQLSESNRYLYMIVPVGLAILALASVMRVWTAAVFFLIILFGGYGVMLTSMAKHREDIQLTPKQIWGSAAIAFVGMLLLRLVEYLVFKM
jgi:hypothetical protein